MASAGRAQSPAVPAQAAPIPSPAPLPLRAGRALSRQQEEGGRSTNPPLPPEPARLPPYLFPSRRPAPPRRSPTSLRSALRPPGGPCSELCRLRFSCGRGGWRIRAAIMAPWGGNAALWRLAEAGRKSRVPVRLCSCSPRLEECWLLPRKAPRAALGWQVCAGSRGSVKDL